MTAQCIACQYGTTVEELCKEHPEAVGCPDDKDETERARIRRKNRRIRVQRAKIRRKNRKLRRRRRRRRGGRKKRLRRL